MEIKERELIGALRKLRKIKNSVLWFYNAYLTENIVYSAKVSMQVKICDTKYIFISILFVFSRFGDGYTIILRLSTPSTEPCPVDAFIQSSFPGIQLKERHQNVLQYQLPSQACSLACVFEVLSNNYEELGIADYSVSQTTLDQVREQCSDSISNPSVLPCCLYRQLPSKKYTIMA